jgi:anti-sigma B factor antagonist
VSEPDPTGLNWSVEEADTSSGDTVAVLALKGDLDLASVADFERAIAEAAPRLLVLDLSGVRFIDSSGIHAVVRARLERASADGDLQIAVAPESAVDRVLEMSGLGDELPPHPDRDTAMAALDDGAGK